MTQTQRDAVAEWWSKTKDIVAILAGLTVVLAAVYGGLNWITGGVQTKAQSTLDEFRTQLTAIQLDQGKAASAAVAAQDKIIARLDALPRPKDYSDQEVHLHDLDHRVDILNDGAIKIRSDLDHLMQPAQFRQAH
jgi:hypothetical protein